MARKWWTLWAVCTATFMLLLDITIVNVALPAIQRALSASFSDLQWVVNAYALGLATCVLTSWLSWRWIFLVNIPIGVGAVVLAVKQLRESSDPEHSRLDPIGLVTLTGGLFCLILALIEGNRRGWSSGLIIALLIAGGVL